MTCQACGATGEDKRILAIDCFYDLTEVIPDFERVEGFYQLTICKSCRASFMDHLGAWWGERKARRGLDLDHDGDEIRNGDTRNG